MRAASWLTAVVLATLARPAAATYASLDLRAGSGVSTETLAGGGDFAASSEDDPRDVWDWSASLNHTKTESSAGDDDLVVGRGGLEWTYQSSLSLRGQAQYGSIATENLTEDGYVLGVAYEWDGEDREFQPWVRADASAGLLDFTATYSGTRAGRRGKAIPVTGELGVRQTHVTLDLSGAFVPWWSAGLTLTRYAYGRDLTKLYDALGTPAALRRGAAGFGDTVGGFPASSLTLNFTFTFTERWRLSATQNFSTLAVDQSPSRSTEVLLGANLTRRFRLSAGVERDLSDQLNATLAVLVARQRF